MDILKQTIKLYGLSSEQIDLALSELDIDKSKIKTFIKEKYLDALLFVEALNNDEQTFVNTLSKIVNKFKDFIYAESDISLYERLFECLKVRNKTLCLAEQGTGGIISSNLLSFDRAEKFIKMSYVVPSIKSLIDHFDLNPFKFTANRGVCNEIAFDIASHMRARICADFYIVSLSTLADGNDLYYNGDVVNFVAIGSAEGVKIHKLEFQGTKRDIMNQVAKTICFNLINIIK